MRKILIVYKKIINSYPLQWLLLAVIAFIGFYKIFTFTFHHNREIVSILPALENTTIIKLMQSHVFIHYFNILLYGPNVWGWYLTALLLHIFATCMIVVFVTSLTKSRILGFITALWFVVSTAWHDAVTFGTQEAVIPMQLFLFLIAIYFFTRFRNSRQKWISYLITLLFFLLLTPLRESGLFYYLLIFVYDCIFFFPYKEFKKIFRQKKQIKSIFVFFAPYIPLAIIAISYLFIRSSYGGSPDDASDDRVKLKDFLLLEKKYLEYAWNGLLAFGFYLPPHIVPYEFMNTIREIVYKFFPYHFVKLYFFTFMGYIYYFSLLLVTYILRKTAVYKILLFAIFVITIPTLFYSFAFTPYEPYFLRDYGYDENRWRYVAFFGTSLFLVTFSSFIFKKYFSKKAIIISIVIILINIFINIRLLWFIEDKMYNESFKPQKKFYDTFLKLFPKYENNYAVYTFPKAPAIGDYMWEWYGLRKYYYPNLTQLRSDWGYGEMSKVLKTLQNNPKDLRNFFFVDFDPEIGIINYTEEVRKLIQNQNPIAEIVQRGIDTEGKIVVSLANTMPIEFPYDISFSLRTSINREKFRANKKRVTEEKFSALINFAKSHALFLNKVNIVSVCDGFEKNYSSEAFEVDHFVDGNLGKHSMSYADCFLKKITIDLGEIQEVAGMMISGQPNDQHIPNHYIYEISLDGKNWKKVMEVNENNKSEIMNKWDQIYSAKYIQIKTISTQTGSWVQLEEIEPVFGAASNIFSYYSSPKVLLAELRSLYANASFEQVQIMQANDIKPYGSFSWKTNISTPLKNDIEFFFPFTINGDSQTYTYKIYDLEYYSNPKEFLKRRINEIRFDFGLTPFDITLEEIHFTPRFPIKK